jgi:hypothetical protein
MLAALVEKTTGLSLVDYLKPRLFAPLGIKDLYWWKAGDGTTFGGFGLHLRTGEIARFGQLLLQKGEWNGKQLVPADWISAATSTQTPNGDDPTNDWNQGYGFQFWMCRNRAFRGDGAFGQFCIVMPDRDAVLAVTSGTGDMGKVMQIAWDKLLPALEPAPLAPDGKGSRELAKALAGLTLRPLASMVRPAGKLAGGTYVFPANAPKLEKLRLEAGKLGAVMMVVLRDGREWRIACGDGTWVRGSAAWGDEWERPVAASGGWTEADTFTARICHLDGAFVHTVRLVFAGNELVLGDEANVGFGPTKMPDLRGVAEPAPPR